MFYSTFRQALQEMQFIACRQQEISLSMSNSSELPSKEAFRQNVVGTSPCSHMESVRNIDRRTFDWGMNIS